MVLPRWVILALFGDVLFSQAVRHVIHAGLGDGAATSFSPPGATSGGVAAKADEDIPQWQIAQGPRKEGFSKATMVLPATTKMVTNVAAGGALAAGYVAGTATAKVTGGKVVDSTAFQLGLKSVLLANGISPKIDFRPIDDDVRARLAELYAGTQGQRADETRLTPVIVSNHVSYLDGLVLGSVFNAPKIVAKASIKDVPVLGKLAEAMEVIFVDRAQGVSRKATLEAIKQHCDEWSFGERPLLVFPEGTTTNGEELLPFKRGAFASGAPVRPVLIVPTGHWDPAATPYKMTPQGPKETTDKEYAMQFVGHWFHSMHIAILPPYVPSVAERKDRNLYAANVRAMMAEELARLREELYARSWKAAAGRQSGGMALRMTDIPMTGLRKGGRLLSKLKSGIGRLLSKFKLPKLSGIPRALG